MNRRSFVTFGTKLNFPDKKIRFVLVRLCRDRKMAEFIEGAADRMKQFWFLDECIWQFFRTLVAPEV